MKTVITGAAVKCSVGDDRSAVFEALCQGRSGVAPLRAFDPVRFNVRNAYEIADRTASGADRVGRASEWLRDVTSAALVEAKVDHSSNRIVVLVGTGLRELRSVELWWMDNHPVEPAALHFAKILRDVLPNAAVYTISNACSASNFALGLGHDLIELGEADIVVAAGVDTITESMFGLLDRVNPTKPDSVQPFDKYRKGVIMGEGSAAVVIESEAHARARGVAPQAILRGVGMSCDAQHETAPDRAGITRAIRDAHERAEVSAAEIDLLMLHGTGTHLNDKTEALAVSDVFAEAQSQPWASGIKSMTGHTSGASGLLGVVTAIDCLRTGAVPPTVGLVEPIPEVQGLRMQPTLAHSADLQFAQVNAFGFGGVNAVVILERVQS